MGYNPGMESFRSALSVDPGAGSNSPERPADLPRPRRRKLLGLEEFLEGIEKQDRTVLARAITLVESNHPGHASAARQLLSKVMPRTGKAVRVGITGVPGVGKSTFIEAFGTNLTAAGHHVAVLAVDPSSGVTGGSILGDKTRMARLSVDPKAFIRPSPSAGNLGGVARKTRETMLLCDAAGFDVILVETVGVGQSETVVAEMTDFFLALMLPGAGDGLQGIKRGLLELVDMMAVNKADGQNLQSAQRAARDYAAALHTMQPREGDWEVPVVTCSAVANTGLEAIWAQIVEHRKVMTANGVFEAKRKRQQLRWMWAMVEDHLRRWMTSHPVVSRLIGDLEKEVTLGTIPPTLAAEQIIQAFEAGESHHTET